MVLLPSSALADGPEENPYGDAWRLGEIYFEPPDPVPGRRVYVERLAVSGDTAAVTLRAAHDLDLKGRVFGGRTGKTLKMGFNTTLTAGQSKSYNLTLDGPSPSFTFSWQDALGFSGAASVKSHQIPYPLPTSDGELCDLEVTSLEWAPGRITGVIASQCITETRHEEDLPVYGGHFSQSVPAMLDATVTGITGTVSVTWGGHSTTAAFVPDGETAFTLPVVNNRAGNRRAGNHGGPDGHAERPPPAHVADHPPPGPHRRAHPPCDLPLRGEQHRQDGPHLRPPPGARSGGGEPAVPGDPHPDGEYHVGLRFEYGPGRERRGRRPLSGPLRAPTHP